MEGHTNWLALVAAAFSTQLIGFIWYNPKVLGTIWMQETGLDAEKQKKTNMPLAMALSLLLMFVVAYALKYVAHGDAEYVTFKHGAYHAFMDGSMIIVPVIAILSIYEQKSIKYFAINTGYWLLCFVTMGGIISWWR